MMSFEINGFDSSVTICDHKVKLVYVGAAIAAIALVFVGVKIARK
jgi:hypothetical protein